MAARKEGEHGYLHDLHRSSVSMMYDDERLLYRPPGIRISVADYTAPLRGGQLDVRKRIVRATIGLEDSELMRFVRLLRLVRRRPRPALRLIRGGKR
jgi:hypothetical protein